MDSKTRVRLDMYADLLFRANRDTNLVSRRLSATGVRNLVRAYSGTLPACGVAPEPGDWLLDIGSGGGLPGIPIAIAHPDLDITLNESRRLRVLALESFVEELDLSNCEVLPGRIEGFELDRLVTRPGIVTAFGVGKALDVIPIVAACLADGGVGLVSIPSDPTREEQSRWLLTAAMHRLRASVHERVLDGERSVLALHSHDS